MTSSLSTRSRILAAAFALAAAASASALFAQGDMESDWLPNTTLFFDELLPSPEAQEETGILTDLGRLFDHSLLTGRFEEKHLDLLFETAAKHPDIEAVVIASANDQHLKEMKLCAERGVHILSMKIPTFDPAEYDEMVEMVEKAGIVCQIELEMHYNPVVKRLYELVGSGRIG